ncbi:MAG: metallophosphoesterase [Patescibacteria group bacterium]|nr:metallophosphoesterase [Patescibacteria group bacterium]
MEKTKVTRFLLISDTHDCPDEDFYEIAEIGKVKGCNVIIHAGDILDKHIGHPALKDFQVYFYYVPLFNKRLPSQYKLPDNWHLLKGGDSVLHFNYNGYDGQPKEYCIYVSHNLGFSMFDLRYLKAKVRRLFKKEKDSLLYEVADLILNRFKKVHKWINAAVFGHSHRGFLLCAKGDKLINPSAWFRKKCFAILKPGPLDVHYYSLTENEFRVISDLKMLKD